MSAAPLSPMTQPSAVAPQRLVGKHLHLDCTAGIAGDMFLGALLDLGVPETVVREALAALPLPGYRLEVGRREHMGIVGCDVAVRLDHAHAHPHRPFREIRELLTQSTLRAAVKTRALDIFSRLAQAEGKVHDIAADAVIFHEVGGIDAIVDIVGSAVALDYLAPVRVTSGPVPLGAGRVTCAHGTLPVPAPATVALLCGFPVTQDAGVEVELTTPTGAAIVASTVSAVGPVPAGTLLAVGYGAGDRVLPDRPNHLRVLLIDPVDAAASETAAILLEANLDDMTPELAAYLAERLLAAGALDAWYTPVTMKKGRPAWVLSLLCRPEARPALAEIIFRESTTIGLRWHAVERQMLTRRETTVETVYGPLSVKEALAGRTLYNVAPEFEACRQAAQTHHVPLKDIYQAALAAYADRRAQEEPALRVLRDQMIHAEKLSHLGQIAAGVVHELNTPLTSISVYGEYLLQRWTETGQDADDIRRLSRVVDGAHRIHKLTRNLLQYARRSGDEPVPLSFNEVVDEAISFCEHLLERSAVVLDRMLAPELMTILATRDQLQQVVINLIANACEAMREGGTLHVATENNEDGTVSLSIADTGCGIDHKDVQSIFEPFFSTKGEGTGLGLCIVKNIIEFHRGTITVRSDKGSGTCFRITLPAC